MFFDVGANEILLDAALRNGVKIPFDCREGGGEQRRRSVRV
ncbi:2Fe-2S iron-sulfur cluster-binding protein [Paraburkholderia lacunae]